MSKAPRHRVNAVVCLLALEVSQDRERREPRGFVALLHRELAAELAKRTRERAIGVQWPVPRDECVLAADIHETKRQHHARR